MNTRKIHARSLNDESDHTRQENPRNRCRGIYTCGKALFAHHMHYSMFNMTALCQKNKKLKYFYNI